MIDVVSPRMRHSARVRFQMRSHSVNPLCCQFTTTTTAKAAMKISLVKYNTKKIIMIDLLCIILLQIYSNLIC